VSVDIHSSLGVRGYSLASLTSIVGGWPFPHSAGRFHHDTIHGYETVPVADGELLGFAKRTLALIYENG